MVLQQDKAASQETCSCRAAQKPQWCIGRYSAGFPVRILQLKARHHQGLVPQLWKSYPVPLALVHLLVEYIAGGIFGLDYPAADY